MSHTSESCHISMSHVTVSDIKHVARIPHHKIATASELRHISVSHVTYQWVMSRIRHQQTCCTHPPPQNYTCQIVINRINQSYHISMSHVTYQWFMSHMNETCRMSMSHVASYWVMSHVNASCPHTYRLTMSSQYSILSMSHVTSCLMSMRHVQRIEYCNDMFNRYVCGHDALTWDMTPLYTHTNSYSFC